MIVGMAHELRKEEEERQARARAAEPQSGFSRQMQSTFARALLPQRSNRVAVDAKEVDGRYNDVHSEHGGAPGPETAEGVLGKAISGALAGGMPNSGGPRRQVAKAAVTMTGSTVDGEDEDATPAQRIEKFEADHGRPPNAKELRAMGVDPKDTPLKKTAQVAEAITKALSIGDHIPRADDVSELFAGEVIDRIDNGDTYGVHMANGLTWSVSKRAGSEPFAMEGLRTLLGNAGGKR